jgi:hypothetical protein
MNDHDPRPTFREARERHNIKLEWLVADIDAAIAEHAIRRFDESGEGISYVVDACLDALSHLSGEHYTRENIRLQTRAGYDS